LALGVSPVINKPCSDCKNASDHDQDVNEQKREIEIVQGVHDKAGAKSGPAFPRCDAIHKD